MNINSFRNEQFTINKSKAYPFVNCMLVFHILNTFWDVCKIKYSHRFRVAGLTLGGTISYYNTNIVL